MFASQVQTTTASAKILVWRPRASASAKILVWRP